MLMRVDQLLDLPSTLQSGQAFRWRLDGGWFHGVVFGNLVRMRQASGGIEFSSAPDDESYLEPSIRDYLGLSVDLEEVYAALSGDEMLEAAIERHRGMRVLRQEPWECLVSFICSSASNIPRISKNVESICAALGKPIRLGEQVRNTFPTPHEIADAGETRLRGLGLGYRAAYLAATARKIAEGEPDLITLREAPYEEALEALVALDGVGDKVANCVLLFSLDKPQAFPVDGWIDRVLRERYLDGEGKGISRTGMRVWALEHFGPYAGYANQYLFHERRLRGREPSP